MATSRDSAASPMSPRGSPSSRNTPPANATVRTITRKLSGTSITSGVEILANYFQAQLSPDSVIYRYTLKVDPRESQGPKKRSESNASNRNSPLTLRKSSNPPGNPSTGTSEQNQVSARVLRRVIYLLIRQLEQSQPRNPPMGSDFRTVLVSLSPLPNPIIQTVQDVNYYEEEELGPQPGSRQYQVQISPDRRLLLRELLHYMNNPAAFRDSNGNDTFIAKRDITVSALNMILSRPANMRTFTDRARNTLQALVKIGPSRYFRIQPANASDQTGPWDLRGDPNLEVRVGFHISTRPSTHNRLLLNVNATTSTFYRPLPLLDIIKNLDPSISQTSRLWTYLRGLRVRTNYVRRSTGGDERNRTIIMPPNPKFMATAGSTSFLFNNVCTTVLRYWQQVHPNINIGAYDLLVCTGNRPDYIPAKCLTVLPGNLYKQQTDIVDLATRGPAANYRLITNNGFNILGLRPQAGVEDVSEIFGFGVDPRMIKISAKYLSAPGLQYSKPVQASNLQKGSWMLANQKPFRPAKAGICTFIILEQPSEQIPEENLRDWYNSFDELKRGFGIGGEIRRSAVVNNHRVKCLSVTENNAETEQQFEDRFIRTACQLKSETKATIFIVLLPNRNAAQYSAVKRCGDKKTGFRTICRVYNLIKTVVDNKPVLRWPYKTTNHYDGLVANILLKLNLKMSPQGVNQALKAYGPILDKHTMLIGLDVTHPGPGALRHSPSVAAAVGSVDEQFSQYPASLETNPRPDPNSGRSMEQIVRLEKMIIERLESYKEARKALPHKLIIYRDGLAEQQFTMCTEFELPQIKSAVAKVYGQHNRPKILLICSVKRHHTRFFPTTQNQEENQYWHKNMNPRPGCLVDSDITYGQNKDFYLVSHHALKGTARPTHYIILYDEINATLQEVASMTHNLCYLFGRATRSVGLCPPAYYADLAADRARCYVRDVYVPWDPTATYRGGDLDLELHPDQKNSMFYI